MVWQSPGNAQVFGDETDAFNITSKGSHVLRNWTAIYLILYWGFKDNVLFKILFVAHYVLNSK